MKAGMTRLRELTVRYSVKKQDDGQPVAVDRILTRPSESAAALMTILENEPAEVFAMLCLTTKHRIIAYHEVSRGTLDSTLVDPREVFTAALLTHAAAIIIAHVHPSGDPTPSPDDVTVTQRLTAAGAILGIDVLDHIIVGHGKYYSFKEMSRL